MRTIETRVIMVFIGRCGWIFLVELNIPCQTKYKSNQGDKAVYNYAILCLIILMIIGVKISDDPENDLINLWPDCNPIALNKIMLNIWIK